MNVENKFFKNANNCPSPVKRIAEKIKSQNEKFNFLNDIISKEGLPVWEKSKMLSGRISNGNTAINSITTGSTDTIVIIPLALENKEWVNSFLFCRVKDSIEINLYSGRYYKDYAPNRDSFNADKIALVSMFLEKSTFGHNSFIIRDNNLLKTTVPKAPRRTITFFDENNSTQNNSIITYGSLCLPSTTNANGQLLSGGLAPGQSTPTNTSNICFSFTNFSDEDEGSGGGTTGSVNWWSPPPGGSGGLNNGTTLGTGGWVSYSFSGARHLDAGQWQMTMEDGQKINNWKNNNIDKDSLDPCMQEILNELLNCGGTNPLGRILAKFNLAVRDSVRIYKFNIKYVTKNLTDIYGNTRSGNTSFTSYTSSGNFYATIYIDSLKSKYSTDLYNANTIIHETIHAYLIYLEYQRSFVNNTPYPPAWYMAKPLDPIFDEYVDTLISLENRFINLATDDSLSSVYQHNFMSNKIVNLISESLQKYATAKGISGVTDEYAWKLAWGGLHNTKAFSSHWINGPNFPVQSINNLTTIDSTRGLKYALTPQWCQDFTTTISSEMNGTPIPKGRLRNGAGCY